MASASRKPVTMAVRFVAGMVLYAAVLFASAGTVRWPGAWGYLTVITGILIVYSFVVLKIHPDLLQERLEPPPDAKAWDKPLVAIIAVVGPFVMLLVSGLDHRFRWSPPASAGSVVAGLVLVAAGGALTNYAVAANPFFSGLVRIQRDRDHRVVDAGPYQVIRHPGYLGSIATMFGSALALASRAGLIVAALLSLVTVLRTTLEERALLAELEGYSEYARRVRYRLVPGVW